MNIITRRAIIGDEQVLARLAYVVHELHHARRPDRINQVSVGELANWYRQQLEIPTTLLWISELDGRAAGYAMAALHERTENVFVRSRRWCELEQLGVELAWRRRGVASALIQAVRMHASAEGVSEMGLTVWDFNDGARRCFEALGFRPITHRLELEN